MPDETKINKGRNLLKRLAEIVTALPDEDVARVMDRGALDGFLNAIFNTRRAKEYRNIGEFFLAHKNRATIMAGIRRGITKGCAVTSAQNRKAFISPHEFQWVEDGVILLEGSEPFAGFICRYRNGEAHCAVVARDIRAGEEIGPEDFIFVSTEEANAKIRESALASLTDLDVPLLELGALLNAMDSDESKYQELLARHPWAMGLSYRKFQRHERMDDKNIPDFTGVRVHDGCRDIFEIKPPTMALFRKDGTFTAEFLQAWDQAERYLGFSRENADYLYKKGMNFENPMCTLISGYKLTHQQRRQVQAKEKMNPALHLLTFDDLLAFMASTAKIVKRLSADPNSLAVDLTAAEQESIESMPPEADSGAA